MQRPTNAGLAFGVLSMASALCGVALAADTPEFVSVRDQIVAAYRRSIDALNRGDAEAAMGIDTDDWVSDVAGQPRQTIQQIAPLIRRDIASMKMPPEWKVVWLPDYEHNGTVTGIQIYDLKLDGKAATVLYLVGSTHDETIEGAAHRVWYGSHARDSWRQTPTGWKRHRHEKLTINERLVDGKPAKSS